MNYLVAWAVLTTALAFNFSVPIFGLPHMSREEVASAIWFSAAALLIHWMLERGKK